MYEIFEILNDFIDNSKTIKKNNCEENMTIFWVSF